MIELPNNFVSDMTAAASAQLANFSSFETTIIGLLLALLALGALVAFVHPGKH